MIELNRKDIVFIILIALSIILWAYFFNASGIALKELFNFTSIGSITSKITSSSFILFLLLFPLTIALIAVYSKTRKDKIISIISSLIGVLIGLIVSLLAFSNLTELWIAGLFYLIGITLSIEMTYTRLEELKKYIAFRILGEASHKIVLLTAVGLFLSAILITLPDKESFSKDLEQSLINNALKGVTGKDNSLTEVSATAMIAMQKETVQQLTAQEQFQKLKTSTDPNAQAYALSIEQLQNYMSTPEYKQQVLEEAQKKQESSGSTIGEEQVQATLESMKQKMPLYGLIMNYMWLIVSFALMSIFLLIGNTIFWFLAVAYGLIINFIAESIYKTQNN
ncbi:MAG: hypothetical protein AB1467_06060 [Candidatus Diapherotrites archaeon]